jgi:hypothetical protein
MLLGNRSKRSEGLAAPVSNTTEGHFKREQDKVRMQAFFELVLMVDHKVMLSNGKQLLAASAFGCSYAGIKRARRAGAAPKDIRAGRRYTT